MARNLDCLPKSHGELRVQSPILASALSHLKRTQMRELKLVSAGKYLAESPVVFSPANTHSAAIS